MTKQEAILWLKENRNMVYSETFIAPYAEALGIAMRAIEGEGNGYPTDWLYEDYVVDAIGLL